MLKKLLLFAALSIASVSVSMPSVSAEDAIPDIPSVVPGLGQEANIITASIEQSSVKAGERAVVDMKWLPVGGYHVSSAKDEDMKPLSVNVSITDESGNFCADPIWRTVFSEDRDLSISAVINRSCSQLHVRIALLDADRKLLDAVDLPAYLAPEALKRAPKEPVLPPSRDTSRSPLMFRLGMIIAGSISFISLIIIFVRNIRKRRMFVSLLFLFGIFAAFGYGGVAEAQTWACPLLPVCDCNPLDADCVISGGVCVGSLGSSYGGGSSGSDCVTLTVEYACSSGLCFNHTSSMSIPVNNGACGSANGGTFASVPSGNLCNSGTASPVYDYGYWSWTCKGTVPDLTGRVVYVNADGYTGPVSWLDWSSPSGFSDYVSGKTFYKKGIPIDPSWVPVTSVFCSASKSAAPVPTLSFWAENSSIPSGTSTNLRWTATNATACTASGAWSGSKAVSGVESTGILSASQVYLLSCTGPGGTSPLYSVPVTVTPVTPPVTPPVVPPVAPPALPPLSLDFTINGKTGSFSLDRGAQETMEWKVSNAVDGTTCSVTSSNDRWHGDQPVHNGVNRYSQEAENTSDFELTCSGPSGTDRKMVHVDVVCASPTPQEYDGTCDCNTEKKSHFIWSALSCKYVPNGQTECLSTEKNACRDFNWKEVAP